MSEGCLLRVTGCLETVCQIVFMVRQVHVVALELPAWNYIGNGKTKEQENNKGSIKAPGKRGGRDKFRKNGRRSQRFFYYCLKISRKGLHRRDSPSSYREQTQKALGNRRMLVVLIRLTSRQATALPCHLV